MSADAEAAAKRARDAARERWEWGAEADARRAKQAASARGKHDAAARDAGGAGGARDFSSAFEVPDTAGADGAAKDAAAPPRTVETDARRLSQRQKQIDFGKNTLGYARYCELVPRRGRKAGHPRTPDVHKTMPKRTWDAVVREWRRALHRYDPDDGQEAGAEADDAEAAQLAQPAPLAEAEAAAAATRLADAVLQEAAHGSADSMAAPAAAAHAAPQLDIFGAFADGEN
jgi:histone RNA hairpin-binding protein